MQTVGPEAGRGMIPDPIPALPSPASHLPASPPSSVIPECPGHRKPNLKESQRPSLQQSGLQNVAIVPPETQVRESETP